MTALVGWLVLAALLAALVAFCAITGAPDWVVLVGSFVIGWNHHRIRGVPA